MKSQISNNLSTPALSQKRIWKWYLILSIIYSSIAILYGLFILMPSFFPPIVFNPIYIIWIWVNIAIFILIFIKKIEKIALLLPSLYLLDLIFSEIISFKLGVSVLQNPVFMALVLLLFPVITLGIAIDLIARK